MSRIWTITIDDGSDPVEGWPEGKLIKIGNSDKMPGVWKITKVGPRMEPAGQTPFRKYEVERVDVNRHEMRKRVAEARRDK